MIRNSSFNQHNYPHHNRKQRVTHSAHHRSLSAPCRYTLPFNTTISLTHLHQKSGSDGYLISPHAQIRKIKQDSTHPIEVRVFKCFGCDQIRDSRLQTNLHLPPGQTICQFCELAQKLVVLAKTPPKPPSTPYQPSSRVKLRHCRRHEVTSYHSVPVECRKPKVVHRRLENSTVLTT